MESLALIRLLADGDYHSGDELGDAMGVSRTAVWKQLKKLESLALPIESVKGKGYCLRGGLDLLNEQRISAQLVPEAASRLRQITLLGNVSSTNEAAMAAAQDGDCTGCAWLAERQTAGRGRRGRAWQSPFGRNIYLSLVWGFEEGAASVEGLSLAVGVAARRAIAQCGIDDVMLKWPNDLLHSERKIGGILLEMTGDPAGFCQVVIGIGLNIGMATGQGESIDQPWTDLQAIAPGPVSRNTLVAEMLNALLPLLDEFRMAGFAKYRREWEAADNCRDQPVTVTKIDARIQGVARGVTDSGALCLEVGGDVIRFNAGEVSLRKRG